MNLDHAHHNEGACDLLDGDGGYPDWVVTTAFYAALHYVEHKIFPLREDGKEYETLDGYHNRGSLSKRTKHETRIVLVKKHEAKAYAAYKQLYDACWSARYYDYRIDPAVAHSTRTWLKIVKEYCDHPKARTSSK